jgi:Family of unknown function (DUF5906)
MKDDTGLGRLNQTRRNKATGRASPSAADGVSVDDFHAYMPQHAYIFEPTREMWPASSVNARVPPVAILDKDGKPALDKDGEPIRMSASAWLNQHKPVEQMTWVPGEPTVVKNRLISDGGWIERKGCTVFNLYRPPIVIPKAGDAAPWLNHIYKVYPEAGDHIMKWLAHRVQHPNDKINHALVLGGKQGIGKDTLLEPVKHAVGPWNFVDVTPRHLLGRFNGFAKSVILRVSEARDLGDVDRYAFYDHMKLYTAAPPDVLRVDEKNLREYTVFNICGVIITSNHKADGIFLPADDRRHFVAWSALSKEDFDQDYWTRFYRYYVSEGNAAVAEYLATFDLSGFDPKAPPPKTESFWEIVDASRSPEDAELADALDALRRSGGLPAWPDAVTVADVVGATSQADFIDYLKDRRNSRKIPHRFEACGYTPVRNPGAEDGMWAIRGRRQAIYALSSLSFRDRHGAATARASQ